MHPLPVRMLTGEYDGNTVRQSVVKASLQQRARIVHPIREQTAPEDTLYTAVQRPLPEDATNYFVDFRPVSLYFVEKFWKEVKAKKRFEDVQIFELQRGTANISRGKSGRLVRKQNMGSREFYVLMVIDGELDAQFGPCEMREEVVEKEILEEKDRVDWTVSDLVHHCIIPFLQSEPIYVECFNDLVEDKFLGKQYTGGFVVISHTTRMEKLLDEMIKDSKDRDIDKFNIYTFFLFFGTRFERVRRAQAASGTVPDAPMPAENLTHLPDVVRHLAPFRKPLKMQMLPSAMSTFGMTGINELPSFVDDDESVESEPMDAHVDRYRQFVQHDLHHAILSFGDRLIVIGDFFDSDLLKSLWCVWQLYGVLSYASKNRPRSGDEGPSTYDATYPFRVVDSIPYNMHDWRGHQQVDMLWDSNKKNFFNDIQRLDHSVLMCASKEDEKILRRFMFTQQNGFSTIKSVMVSEMALFVVQRIDRDILGDRSHNMDKQIFFNCSVVLKVGDFMLDYEKADIAEQYYRHLVGNIVDMEFNFVAWVENGGKRDELPASYPEESAWDLMRYYILGLSRLAKVLNSRGSADMATQLLQKATSIVEKLPRDKSLSLMECELVHAEICSGRGEHREAIESLETVVLMWVTDKDMQSRLPDVYRRLGRECAKAGQMHPRGKYFEKGIAAFSKALAKRKDLLSFEEWETDLMRADLLIDEGKINLQANVGLDTVVEGFERAKEIIEKVIGGCNERIAVCYHYIGNCEAKREGKESRSALALLNYEKAKSVYRDLFGFSNWRLAVIHNLEGLVHLKDGDLEKAEKSFRTAIEMRETASDDTSARRKLLAIASWQINLGDTLLAMKRRKEAAEVFKAAHKHRLRELSQTHPDTLEAYYRYNENTDDYI